MNELEAHLLSNVSQLDAQICLSAKIQKKLPLCAVATNKTRGNADQRG